MAPTPSLGNLSNPLATPAQLETSSSSLDSIPADLEASIRYAAVRLTQAAGVLLHLPQDVIAQAIVMFTRFWVGPEGGSLAVYSAKVRSSLDIMFSINNTTLMSQEIRDEANHIRPPPPRIYLPHHYT